MTVNKNDLIDAAGLLVCLDRERFNLAFLRS